MMTLFSHGLLDLMNIPFGLVPTANYILKLINRIYVTGHALSMDMRRLVGKNFARLRRELGLTQEQAAERTGFSQQYLSGLEQGRRNPTIVTIFEIANALDASYLDLLRPDGGTD